MEFTKMHGLGNDYIYLNCLKGMPDDPGGLSRRLSDRHFGIGGDGIICVCPSMTADFRMRMFNADGSEGAMCGNGIRCFGKYVYDQGLTNQTRLTIETGAGVRILWLNAENGTINGATVDMGEPAIEPPIEISVKEKTYTATPVSVGNPHCVVRVDDPGALELRELGPVFEHWPYFPDGTNTEFVRVLSDKELQMRVWERGSGETLACGTGACAAAAAMAAAGETGRNVTVYLPGGALSVRWEAGDGHMYMTGPAVTAFCGRIAD